MEESKWEILKKKQAENIAKLAEKHPDNWLFSSEMKKPENQRVGFAPSDGKWEDIEDYDYYEDVYSDLDGYDNNDIYQQ